MDQFEQRMRDLREALNEVEQPNREQLWGRLQKTRSRRANRKYWWSAAAMILLLLVAGFSMQQSRTDSDPEQQAFLSLEPEQQRELERYQELLKEKENALNLPAADSITYQEWQTELQILESNQQQFTADLASLPKDDRYTETMIRFYEQKIRIMELFSKKIQLQKNEEERLAQERI